MKMSVVILLFFLSCSGRKVEGLVESEPLELQMKAFNQHYDFDQYDEMYPLDNRLIEISGLSDYDDGTLAAVNDEKGNIYLLNKEDMSISQTIDFGSKGDYEGIERVAETIYIVKSNGNIECKTD